LYIKRSLNPVDKMAFPVRATSEVFLEAEAATVGALIGELYGAFFAGKDRLWL
jgi:hypothetical protein